MQQENNSVWSKPTVAQALEAGRMTPAQANRTLAADGGYCASRLNPVDAPDPNCHANFVFDCESHPETTLSGCTVAVRGNSCTQEQRSALLFKGQPAFLQCMHGIDWHRNRPGG